MIDPQTTFGPTALPLTVAESHTFEKGIDLAVLKRGAKDYLDFLDATKEVFFAYLYHRTGSLSSAQAVLSEVYTDSLSRSMSLWWMGALTFRSLLDAADKSLRTKDTVAADIDAVYLANLTWLQDADKKSVATLHDALWSLPIAAQQLLILSLFIGLPTDRIAAAVGKKQEVIKNELQTAKDLLLLRWQPTEGAQDNMNALMFIPGIDIQYETQLRFQVVEKYSALRFRRAQWVILGGLFAVLSNVVVASVLAVAVITQPPTSLRSERLQLASMDAVLLQKQIALQNTQQSIAVSFKETQGIVAHNATRNFTILGLAVALEALKEQKYQEVETNNIIDLMKKASVAYTPITKPLIMAVVRGIETMISWLPNIGRF